MAVVVLGGMITSTLLTLGLVPCAYTYLDDLQTFITRRGRAVFSHAGASGRRLQPIAGASEDPAAKA